MAYTAFISYNTSPDEEVFVYRLQTLAGDSDIRVVLPQRNGSILSDETKRRIQGADCVLAFLTAKLSAQVREELAFAQGREILIVPIYERGVKLQTLKNKYNWIQYNPSVDTPGTVEKHVLDLLRKLKKEKDNRDVVLLALLGIGLLALMSTKK